MSGGLAGWRAGEHSARLTNIVPVVIALCAGRAELRVAPELPRLHCDDVAAELRVARRIGGRELAERHVEPAAAVVDGQALGADLVGW